MKPMSVSVYFFSGSKTEFNIENYTTVKELRAQVMKKLFFNVSRISYYGLYEVCNTKDKIEERFLDDNERVVDVMSIWSREIEQSEKTGESIEFKLYLKILIYYNYLESDVDTTTQIYYQGYYDYLTGKYNLSEKEIITLASLHLLLQFNTAQDLAYQSLQKNLNNYLPMNRIKSNAETYWIQKIMELYSGLNATSKLEAKLTTIDTLKTNHLWESHQFEAKVRVSLIYISIRVKMWKIRKTCQAS